MDILGEYHHYVIVDLLSHSLSQQKAWVAFVESRLRHFVSALGSSGDVVGIVYPYPLNYNSPGMRILCTCSSLRTYINVCVFVCMSGKGSPPSPPGYEAAFAKATCATGFIIGLDVSFAAGRAYRLSKRAGISISCAVLLILCVNVVCGVVLTQMRLVARAPLTLTLVLR